MTGHQLAILLFIDVLYIEIKFSYKRSALLEKNTLACMKY